LNKHIASGALIATLLAAAACGDSPTAPSPPLSISCPASQTVASPDGNPVAVSFQAPVVSGGRAPVTTTCSVESGARLPVGQATISCTARDARPSTTSCSFQVTVTPPPQLTRTTFTAFGDSITWGVLRPSCPFSIQGFPLETLAIDRAMLAAETSLGFHDAGLSTSYPALLEQALRARYTTQTPKIENRGVGGECVDGCGSNDGVDRLPGVLSTDNPQVLLLQEGVNNINSNNAASIPVVVEGLRTMIRIAQARGVMVFLGTLLPQRVGACRGYAPGLIAPANDAIRTMAQSEGAFLVDLYQAFGGVAGDLLGVDGLHPNEAGYKKIADTFEEEIRRRLEAR
jgi:lysophospholipase L1-like esterase